MKYGFVLPGGSAKEQLEQALIAEAAGWDGVFVCEVAYGVDPWTLLAAMAARTERIRLGTMLTPLPWRRPWKLASQAATLDNLSNGRAIVSVGLGAVDHALGTTAEETDRRKRAEMLDEGIDLMQGLWRGELQYAGAHYQMDLRAREDLADLTLAVQQPIPLWVAAAWPRMKSMRRALRCDGVLPAFMGRDEERAMTPDDIVAMKRWLLDNGARPDIDIVTEGETPSQDATAASAIVTPWAEAGCTWWIESRWAMTAAQLPMRLQQVQERLRAGPPHAI